ncbi:MAG: hypothetical protein DWP94_11680 [Flavobacterium sp.]|nr:MAG: hypothetical protein DWP94_11680 [Flavobacterium sp.]
MKKFYLPFIAIALALVATSCSSDDGGAVIPVDDTGTPAVDNRLVGQITSDMTLTSDVIWELEGRVTVTNGATLTIEPGTIIKAFAGTGANASTLIIARGAQINAVGTAAAPIIFTSIADNIQVGQTSGTNLGENDRGLWGGLLVLGNARASLSGDATENQIEGIPASDPNGLYGGNDDADNSGTLSYISIRHGGALIGEGNEINGLTLGAVGSGTTISNIEVVGNVDDGVEWFGGSVNCSNILVWSQGDDGLDIDEAYSGTITNAAVVLGDISDHGLEIDGPAGTLEGMFTINNLTLIGNENTEGGEYADYRDGAMGTTQNVYARGFKSSSDVELDNNGVSQNFLDGKLVFSNWVVNLPTGVTAANEIFVEKVGCIENCDDGDPNNDILENQIILNPSFTERAANWATSGTAGGADLSAFNWTFTNSKGAL